MIDDPRLASFEADRIRLADRIHLLEDWVDVVSSPMWKRFWFVAQGYRFRRLGVWYHARWNRNGWEYNGD